MIISKWTAAVGRISFGTVRVLSRRAVASGFSSMAAVSDDTLVGSSASSDAPIQRPSEDSIMEAPERGGVENIKFGESIDTELKTASLAPMVRSMWSNIPGGMAVRNSLYRGSSREAAALAEGDATRAMVGPFGLAMEAVRKTLGYSAPIDMSPKYSCNLVIEPYHKGQTAAYNWTNVLIPRSVAYRWPLDLYVDPIYQPQSQSWRFSAKACTLFNKLQGKITVMHIFSGQPLSSLYSGVRMWKDALKPVLDGREDTQMLQVHFHEGWINRRTHPLTKLALRDQVEGRDEQMNTYVYRGKWRRDLVPKLHLYNPGLPVVLLIDRLGYIRWHAVGLPTEKTLRTALPLARQLVFEKIER
ncbi:hypothetical protein FOZ60_002515 [Perkinsus olseni]|uniref:Uncharacterized protein n=1 Tax=Perkinsus olseni TaxID=32597 RepID=A0A7J6P008_PEROL|nr:hypothetical protein FOZ60_002515 [Perkinsus olseni]